MSSSNVADKATASSLILSLKQTSTSPVKLEIVLRNAHPSSSLSLLTWDSPLDSGLLNAGIIHIKDSETGEEVKYDRIMTRRLLPPPRDAFLEIKPESEATREISLESPRVTLSKGKSYEVSISGKWKALWAKELNEVTDDALNAMGGDEEAMVGEFESKPIMIET